MTFFLREVLDEDHEWLVQLHNDPDVLFNLTNNSPISLESHMNWWNKIKNSSNEKRLIFVKNQEKIGFVKFYSIDKTNFSCILGADIEKSHRGRGYAKIMWKLMIEHCFQELNLYRISLTTAEYNHKAQHIYKSLGFLEGGKLIRSLYRDGTFFNQSCMFMCNENWSLK